MRQRQNYPSIAPASSADMKKGEFTNTSLEEGKYTGQYKKQMSNRSNSEKERIHNNEEPQNSFCSLRS